MGLSGAGNVRAQHARPIDSASKVKITAQVGQPDASGKQVITLKVTIAKGWHIFGNPVLCKELEPVQTVVRVTANGKAVPGDFKYPAGRIINEDLLGIRYRIYESEVPIRITVHRVPGGPSPLDISVWVRAVNESVCILPATVKLTVP
jgi:DsbC/DsbD-like thiol-disulfide interchange protein